LSGDRYPSELGKQRKGKNHPQRNSESLVETGLPRNKISFREKEEGSSAKLEWEPGQEPWRRLKRGREPAQIGGGIRMLTSDAYGWGMMVMCKLDERKKRLEI